MVALVESANNDISKVIATWLDQDSKQNEKFSEKKLAYFCLRAMEAMAYLHLNNIYFGDMKPENLLIFRDYRIKLGDLGISMPMYNPEGNLYLKGMTLKYSMPIMQEHFDQD